MNIQRFRAITKRLDDKLPARSIMTVLPDRYLVEQRTDYLERRVRSRQALHVEQPYRCQDIPRTQLPLVLILSVSITMDPFCPIEFVADESHPFLGEEGLPGEVEQAGNVQVGLIPVIVIRLQAGEG